MDPLAEINRRWSPYNYVENNPIRMTDPDGMDAIDNQLHEAYDKWNKKVDFENQLMVEAAATPNPWVSRLDNIAEGLNKSFNYIWKKSNPGGMNVEEWGFDVTSDSQNLYAEHFHTSHESGQIDEKGYYYSDNGEIFLGAVHDHPYSKKEHSLKGIGIDGGDIGSLYDVLIENPNVGAFVAIESGTKRYAVMVTDVKKATEFFNKNSYESLVKQFDSILKDPKYASLSFRRQVNIATKAILGDSSKSGVKAYVTNDKKKQNFVAL